MFSKLLVLEEGKEREGALVFEGNEKDGRKAGDRKPDSVLERQEPSATSGGRDRGSTWPHLCVPFWRGRENASAQQKPQDKHSCNYHLGL